MHEMVRTIIRAGVVIFTDGGFIAGILSPLLFNPKCLIAQEIAWWSPDKRGADLMDAFLIWGKENGASFTQFTALNNAQFDEMNTKYIEYGFRPTEINYMKAIT